MESLPASPLVYKNPSDKLFLVYAPLCCGPLSSENAPSTQPIRWNTATPQSPSRTGLPVCLCVNVSFQDLAKGGLFLISKTESGRRNQPWTKFTCKIYIVKTLLSFFLFQETVMNFNAVCANAKLCFFSLWCLFSSSHYRSTVLSLVLWSFALTFQSDKGKITNAAASTSNANIHGIICVSQHPLNETWEKHSELPDLFLDRKYHLLAVSEKTSALASFSPVTIPPLWERSVGYLAWERPSLNRCPTRFRCTDVGLSPIWPPSVRFVDF